MIASYKLSKILFLFILLELHFNSISAQNITFKQDFEHAYTQYPSIPKGMLEAIAWNNTKIQHITNFSEPESCHGLPFYYGVMGLIDDGKNYFNANLHLIARLSGINAVSIKNYPSTNILAYAAAFSALQNQYHIFGYHWADYFKILSLLSEIPNDSSLLNEYAFSQQLWGIFSFLSDQKNSDVFQFPDYNIDLENLFSDNYPLLSRSSTVQVNLSIINNVSGNQFHAFRQSADYLPAIADFTTCNFSSRSGTAISAVTIHTMQGSYAGSISWFKNCGASASAHYLIRSSDGQVTQMVREFDKAWHVGSENPYTIGIEHEGFINNPSWYTEAMYQSSANLVKDIVNSGYGINPLRTYFGAGCSGSSNNCQLGGCIKIKGHQQFPNQSHTDPGVNWDWIKYYNLINNNPNVVTFNSSSGVFFDSGGANANYGNDELKDFLIEVNGSANINLHFSQFELETNWDFLYVYDGNSFNAPLIGTFTGLGLPPDINSSGSSIYVRFRSDCATTAPGWRIEWDANIATSIVDTIAPVTQFSVAQNWITQNITQNFIDNDNVNGSGVEARFFSINYFQNNSWNANSNLGFRNDESGNEMMSRYTVFSGNWQNINQVLVQTDELSSNTNIYAPLNQNISNQFLYSWEGKIEGGGTNKRAGFHYFSDNAALPNRGNSYFIWFREEQNQLEFYKVTNDVFSLEKNVYYNFEPATWYSFKLIYNKISGRHEVFINQKWIGDWVDPNPITQGEFISFRSGNSKFSVKNFQSFIQRNNTVNLSVGAGNKMLPFENPTLLSPAGLLCSIIKDSAQNISLRTSKTFNIDFTSPNILSVNVKDGLTVDIDSSTILNSISANWTKASDPHSDIASYWFAVGTLPGTDNIISWKNVGLDTFHITNGLNLQAGTSYYVSIKAENNAGLISNAQSSDGLFLFNINDCLLMGALSPKIQLERDSICFGKTTLASVPDTFSSYLWSNGSNSFETQLPPGFYELTISDSRGCTASESLQIIAFDSLSFFVNVENINCYQGNRGNALAQITSGNPPFSFEWSNNSMDSFAVNLNSGLHSVTVTDAKQCEKSSIFEITEPLPVQGALQINYDSLQNLYLVASFTVGGTPPYQILWDNVSGNNPIVLSPGEHNLLITDQNSCTWDTLFFLFDIITSVNQQEINSDMFLVFPNPASHQIHIQNTLGNNFSAVEKITIQTILGKIIKTISMPKSDLSAATLDLNISFLPKGFYLIILHQKDGRKAQAKFIKQ